MCTHTRIYEFVCMCIYVCLSVSMSLCVVCVYKVCVHTRVCIMYVYACVHLCVFESMSVCCVCVCFECTHRHVYVFLCVFVYVCN